MKIKIGNQLLEAQIKDGRFYVTHTFDQDTDHIDLLSDCLGDTDFKKIQVEKNPDMTYWVPPEVYKGNLSGVFKNLKEINLDMTDTNNSKLWSNIKLNTLGMLEEYHNETLSAEFIKTASGIETRLRKLLTDETTALENRYIETAEGTTRLITDYQNNTESIIQQLKDSINSKVGSREFSTYLSQNASSITSIIRNSGGDIISAINQTPTYTRIKADKLYLDANTTVANEFIAKVARAITIDASQITTGTLNAGRLSAITVDAKNITGDKSSLLQSLWQSLNSYSYIDGTRIQVRGYDGSYVEMNNVPEFRSSDPTGTATVMGMGRTHYLDKYGTSLGYIGMNLYGFDYNGSRVLPGSKYGVWLSRGSGGFSINYMQDGGYVAGSDNVYYTVPQDGMGNTRIIEDIMRVSGGASPFNTYEGAKAEISKLNGYGPWNNAATGWNVTLRKGDRVIYKQGTTSSYVPSGYQRFIDCTDSSNGTKTVYIYTEARLQQFTTFADGIWVKGKARVGSLQNDSDKRLKENIEATSVNALEEIKNLSFKSFDWKKSKEHEPIGLIAQDSGILRIKEDESHEFEAIDLSRALMLSLKAIQELEAKVKKLEVQNGK